MKRWMGWLAFGLTFAALGADQAGTKVALTGEPLDFRDSRYVHVNPRVATVSADGRSLTVDLKSGPSALVFMLRPGLLQCRRNYVIRFRYRVASPQTEDLFLAGVREPRDPFFHFGIRSAADSRIINPLRTKGMAREETDRTLRVAIPATASDFVFHCDAYRTGLRGTIADLRILPEIAAGFEPLTKNPGPYAGPLKLPTGAREFEVALPDNPKGEVVDAAGFGVSPASPDNTAAIRRALEHCRKVGAARLVLPRGTLRFTGAASDGIVMNFEGFKNFEFDGNGARLVFWTDFRRPERSRWRFKQWHYFELKNCRRVRLHHFSVDWDWQRDPLGALVEVVGVNGDEVDYRFCDYARFPRRDLRIAMVRRMHPVSRALWVEDSHHHHYEFYNGKRIPKITWLSDNTIRVKDNGGVWEKERLHLFQPGAFYRLLQYYYDAMVFHNADSSDVSLEDLNICSVPGFMMQSRDLVRNWQLLRVRVAPPADGSKRVITCTADTYDQERIGGNMKMIGCYFTLGNDDAMNLLESNYPAVKTGPFTVRTRNLKAGIGTLRIGDPIEFRRGDLSPVGVISKLKAIRELGPENQPKDTPWVQVERRSWELTFEHPVPDSTVDDLVLFNRKYHAGNVILRQCTFDNVAGRGCVIQTSNVTIENCHYRLVAGLHARTGYTFRAWNEGMGVDNVVIRNNVFELVPGEWDSLWSSLVFDAYLKNYGPRGDRKPFRVFSNILIENNTFIDTYGLVAYFTAAENVIFRRNTLIEKNVRGREWPYRGSFLVSNAKDIFILDNRYVKSPLVNNPGVYYDPGEVENLVIGGNRFQDAP